VRGGVPAGGATSVGPDSFDGLTAILEMGGRRSGAEGPVTLAVGEVTPLAARRERPAREDPSLRHAPAVSGKLSRTRARTSESTLPSRLEERLVRRPLAGAIASRRDPSRPGFPPATGCGALGDSTDAVGERGQARRAAGPPPATRSLSRPTDAARSDVPATTTTESADEHVASA